MLFSFYFWRLISLFTIVIARYYVCLSVAMTIVITSPIFKGYAMPNVVLNWCSAMKIHIWTRIVKFITIDMINFENNWLDYVVNFECKSMTLNILVSIISVHKTVNFEYPALLTYCGSICVILTCVPLTSSYDWLESSTGWEFYTCTGLYKRDYYERNVER